HARGAPARSDRRARARHRTAGAAGGRAAERGAAASAPDGDTADRRPRAATQSREGARGRPARAGAADDGTRMSAEPRIEPGARSDVGLVSWTVARVAGRVTGGPP